MGWPQTMFRSETFLPVLVLTRVCRSGNSLADFLGGHFTQNASCPLQAPHPDYRRRLNGLRSGVTLALARLQAVLTDTVTLPYH